MTRTAAATHEHTAHHVHERVALTRNPDAEVHLADLIQRVVPARHLVQMRLVVALEHPEEICATTRHGEQQQSEEVEKRQRRIYAEIEARTADFLYAERGVRLGKASCELEEALVRGPHVAGDEVGEDCARNVERGSVRVVFAVPFVLELDEMLGRVARAEDKVSFRVVGITVCKP